MWAKDWPFGLSSGGQSSLPSSGGRGGGGPALRFHVVSPCPAVRSFLSPDVLQTSCTPNSVSTSTPGEAQLWELVPGEVWGTGTARCLQGGLVAASWEWGLRQYREWLRGGAWSKGMIHMGKGLLARSPDGVWTEGAVTQQRCTWCSGEEIVGREQWPHGDVAEQPCSHTARNKWEHKPPAGSRVCKSEMPFVGKHLYEKAERSGTVTGPGVQMADCRRESDAQLWSHL